jgi:hypothetical protein
MKWKVFSATKTMGTIMVGKEAFVTAPLDACKELVALHNMTETFAEDLERQRDEFGARIVELLRAARITRKKRNKK